MWNPWRGSPNGRMSFRACSTSWPERASSGSSVCSAALRAGGRGTSPASSFSSARCSARRSPRPCRWLSPRALVETRSCQRDDVAPTRSAARRRGRLRARDPVDREAPRRCAGRSLHTFAAFAVCSRGALWFYASKIVWPSRLSFFYPRWPVDPAVAWQYLFPLAAAVRRGVALGRPAPDRQRRRSDRAGFLRGHALPGPRFFRRLPDAVLLGRGPLPVPGERRTHRARRGRPRWRGRRLGPLGCTRAPPLRRSCWCC